MLNQAWAIPYQSAPSITTFITPPTLANTYLMWNGSAFTWGSGSSGGGTVTSVSVLTANGFAGIVSNAATTPAITLSTSVTGMLKGNGTAISAGVAGVDYSAGTLLLGTGILKSTTSTGALTIAIAADFPILNQNTTGNATTATTATNLAAGSANAIPYQSSIGTTTFLSQGTGVLQETAGAPGWTTTPTLTGTNFTGIPNSALTNSSITIIGSTGINVAGPATLGSTVTLSNTGVISLIAGTNISISSATGAVTVNISGTVPSATTATNIAGANVGQFSISPRLIQQQCCHLEQLIIFYQLVLLHQFGYHLLILMLAHLP